MAAFTAGTPVWNSPAISPAVIHISLPVTLTVLSSIMIMSRFMASLFLDGATCKFFDLVQSCGKVLHVLIELLFGYFRVYLRCLYALVSQHGTDRFDGYAVGEEHRRGCRVTL